jgi:hypothetical protein
MIVLLLLIIIIILLFGAGAVLGAVGILAGLLIAVIAVAYIGITFDLGARFVFLGLTPMILGSFFFVSGYFSERYGVTSENGRQNGVSNKTMMAIGVILIVVPGLLYHKRFMGYNSDGIKLSFIEDCAEAIASGLEAPNSLIIDRVFRDYRANGIDIRFRYVVHGGSERSGFVVCRQVDESVRVDEF